MRATVRRWIGGGMSAMAMAAMLYTVEMQAWTACSLDDLPWWAYWGMSCWMNVFVQP